MSSPAMTVVSTTISSKARVSGALKSASAIVVRSEMYIVGIRKQYELKKDGSKERNE